MLTGEFSIAFTQLVKTENLVFKTNGLKITLITADNCQGRIRHAKRYFPRCLARENIRCDVDENMWANADDRSD